MVVPCQSGDKVEGVALKLLTSCDRSGDVWGRGAKRRGELRASKLLKYFMSPMKFTTGTAQSDRMEGGDNTLDDLAVDGGGPNWKAMNLQRSLMTDDDWQDWIFCELESHLTFRIMRFNSSNFSSPVMSEMLWREYFGPPSLIYLTSHHIFPIECVHIQCDLQARPKDQDIGTQIPR